MAASPTTAFIAFLVIAAVTFFLAYKYGLTFWASTVLALLMAAIIINLFYPTWKDPRFMAISAITSLIVFVYVIVQALNDKRNKTDNGTKDLSRAFGF